jgi:hypothetical protein
MSMTDRGSNRDYGTPTAASPATAPQRRDVRERRFRDLRETKPSFLTTEFWAMVVGIVALVVLYNVTDNPDLTLWRTCLLCTIGAAAYIVSRGWAKSGSHDDHWESAAD